MSKKGIRKRGGRSKIPTSTIVVSVVSIILLLCAIVGGLFLHRYLLNRKQAEWQAEQEVLAKQVESARRFGVYRTLVEVKKGQIITEENVELVDVLSEDPAEVFISEADLGKEATVNIPVGQFVTTNMVTSSLTEDWQERELDCIWLSSNLEQYDYVDVRILYPNGTDYIVLSKKPLRTVDLSVNNVFLWLDEEEILAVNAAIVDANLHGGKIYTTKYVKPAIEEATKPNYIPNRDVINLIKSDKNIVKKSEISLSVAARENMESKLSKFREDYSERKNRDGELGYDFILDDTTNARGEADADNHGSKPKAEEEESPDPAADEESPGLVDTTRNTDASNNATLQEDEAVTNGN